MSVISQEKPSIAFFRFIDWLVRLLEGKLCAYFAGWAKSHLGRGSTVIGSRSIFVGEGSSVGRYAWIHAIHEYKSFTYKPSIKIGVRFYASQRLHISAINSVVIGNDCLFGSSVYVSDHNHGSYKGNLQSNPNEAPLERPLISDGSVVIGSNVWIGDNVVIVGSVKIGDGVVVGANSVITSDIPENTIAVGIPARVIKKFNSVNCKWEEVIKL